jgi:hypothetical protein
LICNKELNDRDGTFVLKTISSESLAIYFKIGLLPTAGLLLQTFYPPEKRRAGFLPDCRQAGFLLFTLDFRLYPLASPFGLPLQTKLQQ